MRSTLRWPDLRGARVGLWGLGREGQACLRKLRSLGVSPVLVDDNPGFDGVLATSAGGLAALERCEVVIKTPGISPYGPEAAQVLADGAILAGGLGLWLNEADLSRVVYVTGTKGKSTTSSVIGHLMTGLGRKTLVGGNFGVAPYDPEIGEDFDYWVIEVSSYTATDVAVTPPVTAVTSLHPDHLPWHGDVERYYRDKLSATSQPGADRTVANGDSELLRMRAGLLGPHVDWVGEADEPGAGWMDGLGLPGRHNRRNALIARRVLTTLAIPGADNDDRLIAAAAGFAPLPSRLTPVGTVAGVTFIDDSLSTNVLPVLAALESFPALRVALIVGGQDRGIDYDPLALGVGARSEPTLVLTIPDSGPRIAAAFAASTPPADSGLEAVRPCADLEEAVAAGFAWAKPDGVVLLSPAAPSFGHFRDYRDRGDQFAAAMRALEPAAG